MVKETANCVRCGKPAKMWGGHVDYFIYKGNKPVRVSVIAGWCGNRCHNKVGFRGMYHPWMGDRLNGELPSQCHCGDDPKTSQCGDNMIHINWPKFRLVLGVIIFTEGVILTDLAWGTTLGVLFGLCMTAMGAYVILQDKRCCCVKKLKNKFQHIYPPW